MAKLSQELSRYFCEEERPDQVQLSDFLEIAKERIFGFLFVILALPSALPIPAPGYSIPFGVVMFLLASQMVIGAKKLWLPQRVRTYQLDLKTVQGFVKKGVPWLQRLETLSRPRLSYVCTSALGRIILGSAITLMSISMMIPIPGTNTLPAIGIFIIGFGLQEDDGLISLGGLTVCVLALVVVLGIIIGGVSLLDYLKDSLMGN
ncbi:exopolysaccharide biosynthesis protein [Dactylococcopsis salina]|uniref:ABC-type transport system, permease component n=1 Tax=Dactylococcopsis salina (strain PCC 8305) TaxID=13035 RepID=K9YRW1_DACS8|nr:exopolysaccharide biosynthesis protein [Dactylococcopsis salina]AFZ49222.1 putative ABC-type transport system, permease component [Dactylococcopsis salina PCC 8305]